VAGYADDAVPTPPGAPCVAGRAAGTVKMASAAGATVCAAKYRTIWHKTDRKWLNIHAMWNDHVPPSPPTATEVAR